MDELQERAELDALIAEQSADDNYTIVPEFRNSIPLESAAPYLGVTSDGAIIDFKGHERGSVLVSGATWHGTVTGYINHRCRCRPCKDAQAARIRRQRAARKERAA